MGSACNTMAAINRNNWVTFEEEDEGLNTCDAKTKPLSISRFEEQSSTQTMSGSLSSLSSSSSFMFSSDYFSRDSSPTNVPENTSKYLPFKELQNKANEPEEEEDEIAENSSSDCKYSVFSNIKEEYLGWSKKVLGESSALGWSEHIRSKPTL